MYPSAVSYITSLYCTALHCAVLYCICTLFFLTSAMPALLVDTSTRSTSPSASSQSQSQSSSSTPSAQPHTRSSPSSRSPSPDRPPVSPITPTQTVAQLASTRPTAPSGPPPRAVPPPVATFRHQPPSLPIDQSENSDAIALRSAISLLQLQREKSKRDLKALEELKQQALSNPKAFAQSLQNQRSTASTSQIDILAPTLSDISDAARKEITHPNPSSRPNEEPSPNTTNGSNGSMTETPNFTSIPQPQNVIRCPPINWAKYHIVGESLDKMHEEQKRHPSTADPLRAAQGRRASPHAVAAPYSPFTDRVGETQSTSQSWRTFKKSPS
ncbi:hypothetical protein DM02DRAFT_729785 [Periconia macrospinosa]|uniref:Uncharacterized protein n=1 Tax=Periconia macrospinosa TaxID=97972 RepID=A0A2V1DLR6_9PLEO|nr:hypothetical protein DM02DRAFT_729785 [Periconia macrospinosa]